MTDLTRSAAEYGPWGVILAVVAMLAYKLIESFNKLVDRGFEFKVPPRRR